LKQPARLVAGFLRLRLFTRMKYQFVFVQQHRNYQHELILHANDYLAILDDGKKLLEQNFYSPKDFKLKKVINLRTNERIK
jgi:hypothetical protein